MFALQNAAGLGKSRNRKLYMPEMHVVYATQELLDNSRFVL